MYKYGYFMLSSYLDITSCGGAGKKENKKYLGG